MSDATFVPAFLAGAVLMAALSRMFALLGREASPAWLVMAPVTFGVLAAVLSRRTPVVNVGGGIGIFAGIPVGIAMDVALGAAVGEPDRNLWPTEILFYWVIAAVPVLLGINAGRLTARRFGAR